MEEDSMEISLKPRNKTIDDTTIPPLGTHPETITDKDTCTPVFIAALFTIART